MPRKLIVPKQPEINVGTVGHVDHGKTTLIQSLTGIWTSSHSEELRRGITIKIGYADMPIYEYTDKNGRRRYSVTPEVRDNVSKVEFKRTISFVDCPGHESLMANMLSGAAVMDGALLVIAANEPCPRPQTKEHLTALEILGIDKIVVIQNKIDLVSREEALRNYEQIRAFLETTSVAKNAPIIPVSSIFKLNTEYVLEAIQKYIPTPRRDLSKPVRMFVIRSFDVNKPGTPYDKLAGGVIGGSILQGVVKIGDELEIVPGYLERKGGRIVHEPIYTEVLSLSTQYLRLKEAHSGGLVGIQTDLDPSLTRADRMVGNVVGKPGTLPEVRYELEMKTTLFKYVVGTDETIKVAKIRVNEPLRLNIGSATTLGIVKSVKDDNVYVDLSKPVAAEKGWKVAIARNVNNRWRLIGVGEVL
ncbi:translation initiation factor IF-2 subunit gamma [Candidatus Geothermarchaeota archaeon]|nr:MAG: translation initiation factor IF-2 subunit gamma [Candidatus Geothermarchaeota archaeon]